MAILNIFSVQLFNIFLEATTRNKSTVLSRRGNFGHLISVFNTAPLFSCNVREMGAFFIDIAPINAFRERYIRDAAEAASAKVAVFVISHIFFASQPVTEHGVANRSQEHGKNR